MNQPYQTRILTQPKQNLELGMDGGEEWQEAVIDLNEVASFFADEHADGSSITSISLKSGNEFSIDVEFDTFAKKLGL